MLARWKADKCLQSTFWSGIVMGIVTHLFALVNVMNNYDNISQTPRGVGTGDRSGRWLLSIINRWLKKVLGGAYNIPMVNGLLAILFLTLAACVTVKIFRITTSLYGMMIAGLFVCFPAATSMMYFMYTAHLYAFAIFLSVLAVWLAETEKCVGGEGIWRQPSVLPLHWQFIRHTFH